MKCLPSEIVKGLSSPRPPEPRKLLLVQFTFEPVHDDVVDASGIEELQREYAYGPAQGLPDTKVGTFTQALYDEAKKDGWTVISTKNDWKRIFAFD